jgi:hypothetical protein
LDEPELEFVVKTRGETWRAVLRLESRFLSLRISSSLPNF